MTPAKTPATRCVLRARPPALCGKQPHRPFGRRPVQRKLRPAKVLSAAPPVRGAGVRDAVARSES